MAPYLIGLGIVLVLAIAFWVAEAHTDAGWTAAVGLLLSGAFIVGLIAMAFFDYDQPKKRAWCESQGGVFTAGQVTTTTGVGKDGVTSEVGSSGYSCLMPDGTVIGIP